MEQFKRRDFLKTFTIMSVSVFASPSCITEDNSTTSKSDAPCETTSDILGPYYKRNAPFRENIIPPGEKGTTLIITGKVYTNCSALLEGALVEIWNADSNGEYDSSEDFKFRGSYKTGTDGIYKFKTIVPGRYLNGNVYRPSHIHFKVSAPGHRDLISQIYFKDDPFIGSDPWARDPKAVSRILTVEKDNDGIENTDFDIHLVEA